MNMHRIRHHPRIPRPHNQHQTTATSFQDFPERTKPISLYPTHLSSLTRYDKRPHIWTSSMLLQTQY